MRKLFFTIIFFLGFGYAFFVAVPAGVAHAAFNQQINYQGRLTTPAGVAVPNGNYNMQFNLYTVPTGGSSIWTETDCYSTNNGASCTGSGTDQRITVTNGLFSVMLGSTTPFANVNFNQTLYLGINIGGSASTPSYDGEMTPRKILGAVPAAMYSGTSTVALTLNGVSNTQFFRNDQQNSTTSTSTFFSVLQSGAGKIAEFFGSATQSVLALLSNGNVGIGSSTPGAVLSVEGSTTNATTTLVSVASSSGASFLTVVANGNVGVGSSTPSALFSVGGNGLFGGNLTTTGTLTVTGQTTLASALNGILFATNGVVGTTSTSSLGIYNYFTNSSATTSLSTGSILSAGIGTFGIVNATSTTGTSTLAGSLTVDSGTLTVNAVSNEVGINTPNPTTTLFVSGSAGTNPFVVASSSNAQLLTLLQNGDVGIGTSTPGSLLTVQGNAYFGGNVTATGTLSVTGQTTLATASSTGLTVTATSTLTGLKLTNLSNTYLALDAAGNLIATTTPGGGTNYFSNSSASTSLTTGSNLLAGIGTFGNIIATSTTASSTFAGAVDIGGGTPTSLLQIGGTLSSSDTNNDIARETIVGSTTQNQTSDTELRLVRDTVSSFYYPATVDFNMSAYNAGGAGTNYNPATQLTIALKNSSNYLLQADTNVITFQNNGNIGIGTSSPFAKLSILGTLGSTTPLFTVASTTSSAGATSTLFTVLPNGNVGIGTSTPGTLLAVQGNAYFGGNVTATGTLSVTGQTTLATASSTGLTVTATSTLTGLKLTNLSNTYLALDAAGNLIATTTPVLTNYFTNSSATTTLTTGTILNAPTGTFGTLNATNTLAVTSTTTLANGLTVGPFLSGTWINLPTTGPSGIGTGGAGVNPFLAYVPVNGNWFTDALAGDSAYRNTTGSLRFGGTSNGSQFVISSTSEYFQNGNVGIGTSTPSARLSVQNAYGSTTPLFDIATTTSSAFATSSLFRVNANGNIGIGTTTPGTLLTVAGNGYFGGTLTVTATSTLTGIKLTNLASTFLAVDSSGNVVATATPSTPPGGSNTDLQYNNSGSFGGTSNATLDSGGDVYLQGNFSVKKTFSTDNGAINTDGSGDMFFAQIGTPNPTIQIGPEGAPSAFSLDFQDQNDNSILYLDASYDFIGTGGNTNPGYSIDNIGDINTTGCYRISGTCINTTQYFSNSGSTTTLSTGSILSSASSTFGSFAATSTTGANTIAGKLAISGQTTLATASSTGLTVTATSTLTGIKLTNLASTFLAVDSSGNVISTTTPGFGTVTSVGLSVPTGLSVSGSPITTSGTLALSLTSGYVIPLMASTTQWSNPAFAVGNQTDFTGTSTDRVSIGTSTPYSKLYVLGTLGSTTPIFTVASTTSSSGATSTLLTVLSNGNVGIGTSTPGSLLTVGGTLNVTGQTTLTNASTTNITASGNLTASTANIGSLSGILFGTNGVVGTTSTSSLGLAPAFTAGTGLSFTGSVLNSIWNNPITSPDYADSGSLGINDDGGDLSIVGNDGVAHIEGVSSDSDILPGSDLLVSDASIPLYINSYVSSGGGSIGSVYIASAIGDAHGGNVYLSEGGVIGYENAGTVYVGQGNSGANGNLIVYGSTGIGTTSPIASLAISAASGTNPFVVASSSGKQYFNILANGFVGIGSTTPGSLLAVSGNAYFGGNVTATGTLSVTGQTTLATASSTGLTVTATSTLTGLKLTNLSNTYLALDAAGNLIATTTPGGGTNYFSNSSASTSLTTGSNLLAGIGTFGTVIATSSATSTFAGGISTGNFVLNGSFTDNAGTPGTSGECLTNAANFVVWGSCGTNYFNKIGPVVGLNTGTTLSANIGTFGIVNATSTTGTSTFTHSATFGGLVGIGTTTPGSALDVGGNITDESLKNCDSSTNAIGTTASGTLVCDTSLSDERLKNDITSLDGQDSLNLIDSLNPVSFYWKDPSIPGTGSTQQQFGFIAQQVQIVAPNLVGTTTPTYLTPDQTYYLNYQGIIAPLVAAVQEQEIQILSIASSTATSSAPAYAQASDLDAVEDTVNLLTASDASTSATLVSLSSTTAALQSQVAAIASTTASTTAATLSASSTFIQTVANAVIAVLQSSGQTIQSAGDWALGQLSATTVISNDIQTKTLEAQTVTTQTASVSDGLEMTDQATGYIYCVRLIDGQFAKTLGTCATAASSTPTYMSSPDTTPTAPVAPSPAESSDSTENPASPVISSSTASTFSSVATTTATTTADQDNGDTEDTATSSAPTESAPASTTSPTSATSSAPASADDSAPAAPTTPTVSDPSTTDVPPPAAPSPDDSTDSAATASSTGQ